uniref:Uncharacterized protein n=1 Tax=Glossina pallidipes TaxID=7398 RepID=A0A1A9ZQS7_GLOPL
MMNRVAPPGDDLNAASELAKCLSISPQIALNNDRDSVYSTVFDFNSLQQAMRNEISVLNGAITLTSVNKVSFIVCYGTQILFKLQLQKIDSETESPTKSYRPNCTTLSYSTLLCLSSLLDLLIQLIGEGRFEHIDGYDNENKIKDR